MLLWYTNYAIVGVNSISLPCYNKKREPYSSLSGRWGIQTPDTRKGYTGFRVQRDRSLCQPSFLVCGCKITNIFWLRQILREFFCWRTQKKDERWRKKDLERQLGKTSTEAVGFTSTDGESDGAGVVVGLGNDAGRHLLDNAHDVVHHRIGEGVVNDFLD